MHSIRFPARSSGGLRRSLTAFALVGAALFSADPAFAQGRYRSELFFPDLPGYVTLRCDFHLHTVFSDGNVWPTVRVEEAWRDGLDAIALTDHVEYTPHKNDVPVNYQRPVDIARDAAASLGLILIRGAEVTRGEPPGHLNALFVTNVAELRHEDYRVSVRKAHAQGAFIFWNHPGWKQPGRKAVWYAEQGEFLTNGWLNGLEAVNGDDYEPIVHQWAVDKRLTLVANSDSHNPVGFDYDGRSAIRPVTLVFARERTAGAIREALFERRTALLSQGKLYGEAQYLEPLFQGAIEIVGPEPRFKGKSTFTLQVRNRAPLDFELRLNPKLPEIDPQEKVTLAAGKVSLISLSCVSDRVTGEQTIALPCRVVNLQPSPEKALRTTLRVKARFE